MLLLALTLAHADPGSDTDWDTLLSDEGWSQVATPSPKGTGPIDLRLKEIGGKPCLRGEVTVQPSADVLLATATDIDGSPDFSRESLLASKVIASDGGRVDYYQVLDVPDWTMASDRYWVLRGEKRQEGEARSFRWNRFDWRAAHPELAAELDAKHAGAVEPQTNWGAWVFQPVGDKTLVRYHLCSSAGGSLPEWIQKAAATKTLPNTMADVIVEAAKRSE